MEGIRMDQNTVKRKIATALAVCLLAASAAPAVLAEDTGIALMEATPSEPTRAALKLTRITPGNGTLEVELTGTAGQNVTVALTTMDEEDVASQTVTLSASGSAVVQFTGLKAGQYAVIAQYVKSPTEKESAWQENIAVTVAEQTPKPSEAITPKPTESSAPVEKITPKPSDSPTPQPTANAFTVGLYAGEGTLEVDVYGGSALELTVTLTKPDGSTEVKTLQNGGGLAKFENLATGTYKVKVDYTTPVFNVQAYTGSVDVTAAGAPTPAPSQIEATASVNGQTLSVTVTNAADKDMVATLLDAAGKAQTAKIVGGQATFTELAAGTYTLVIAYADSSAGNKTITGLTVENKAVAQAITATAAAGVKRIDVDVTAASPLNVAVSLLQNGQIRDTRAIAAGVGRVSFENLAAGTYTVSVDYAPSQAGVSATVIENLNVTEQNVNIAIAGVTPGENKLTVSGTAKPNERIAISTVPDGGSSAIVTSDANGAFNVQLERTAGTYTAVSAEYVGDEASRVTMQGTFVVTGTATKPALDVDQVYNNSLTVVAKTTAGVTVHLTADDYEQTLVADSRGIVRFTLPHTYGQGTRLTLTVYYGAGNTLSYTVDVTVGGTPYYTLLKRGSRGDGVYAVTSRLAELGYPISATNYYNDSVVSAVRLFQSANGLSVDGMAGKLTQKELYSVSAIGYQESGETYPTLVRGDRGMALIYTLQQRLKDLGYYTIRVDGIFGSGTQRAVRWFQSVNGLAVTGKADSATQQLLYSSSARPASGSSSSSSSSTGYRLLYWGCKGDAVKRLQQALIDAGYKNYVRTADGIYGKWTYDAVRAYQKDVGLSVDGIAGKNTQNKLYGTNY